MTLANSGTPKPVLQINVMNCLRKLLAYFLLVSSNFVSTISDKNDYKIFCYYNYWSNYYSTDGKFQVENIDPSLCTHVIYAYVGILSCSNAIDVLILDPQLQASSSYRGKEDLKRFIRLKEKNPKLKCLLGFGGYNGDHELFSSILRNSAQRERFVSRIRKVMNTYCLDQQRYFCFDGVSLEYFYMTREENPSTKYNFTDLVKEIRAMFNRYLPGQYKMVGVAVSSLGTPLLDYYDIPKITEVADFVILNTFDYHGPNWSNNRTGMVAPLYGRKLESGEDTLNQNYTAQMWLNPAFGMDSKKLLLGMPTYGRSFILADNMMNKLGDPTTGAAHIAPYTKSPGFISYHELVNVIFRNNHSWRKTWDADQKVPYAYLDNVWISYENEASFEYKAHYIKEMNLGGAAISSIVTDNFKDNEFPLIRTVKRVFEEN